MKSIGVTMSLVSTIIHCCWLLTAFIFQILRLTALAGGQGHQLLFSVLFFPQWSHLQPPITFPLAFTVNCNHINWVDYDAVMKFEYRPIWYFLDRSSQADGNPSSESLSLVSDVYVVHTTKSSWLNVGLLDRKTPSHSDLIRKENVRGGNKCLKRINKIKLVQQSCFWLISPIHNTCILEKGQ